MSKLYKDPEYCISELAKARARFTTQGITEKEWSGIYRGLTLMYMHCPEDMCTLVLATIREMDSRALHMELV